MAPRIIILSAFYLGAFSLCFGAKKGPAGPLFFSTDILYEQGFIPGVDGGKLKIRNFKDDTVTIEHIFVSMDTGKIKVYEITFSGQLQKGNRVWPLTFTEENNAYEKEGREKIKIPGNQTFVLTDFLIDYRISAFPPVRDNPDQVHGDTMSALLIFCTGGLSDTIRLVGIQNFTPEDYKPAFEPGATHKEFSRMRIGTEMDR